MDLGGGFTVGAEAIFWITDYLDVQRGRADRFSLFATYGF